MRVAAIDLGTNSFLCLIADVKKDGTMRVVDDLCEIVKLGEKVNATRELQPQALERAKSCLARFRARIDELQVEKISATATSAARDAKNAVVFLEMLKSFEIPVKILSGDDEAQMTFLGACGNRPNKNGVAVIDVGGGSTEIFQRDNNGNDVFKSLDMGGVRLLEMFCESDPPTSDQILNMRKFISETLKKIEVSKVNEVIAVGGTPTTLVGLQTESSFDPEKVEGATLSGDQIEKMICTMFSVNLEQRKVLPGMDPKRADTLPVGSIILSETLKYLNKNKLTVTCRGVRYGLASKIGMK